MKLYFALTISFPVSYTHLEPVEYIEEDTVFLLTLKCFGQKAEAYLVDDDGVTYDTEYSISKISFNGDKAETGLPERTRYKIVKTEFIR